MIYHPLIFESRKQTRMSGSTLSAEAKSLMAAFKETEALRDLWMEISGEKLPITLVIEAQSVYKGLHTERNITDPSARPEIDQLRIDYDAGIIDDVLWIPGVGNPADSLTKNQARGTGHLLEEILASGYIPDSIYLVEHEAPMKLMEEK